MTIGLCVIMKNESHVLRRMLTSIFPLLDHYTVIDTGSTDNSKQIVKDFFAEKNIPGEIHDHPFVNFQDARNFSIQKAKDKTDFLFTIDCDEILTLPKDFNISELKEILSKHDLGQIDVRYGGSTYVRRAFFRGAKPFYYFGVVHEILQCDDTYSAVKIEDMYITPKPDGASWQQPQKDKYLGHAKMLMDYIEENGNEPRSVFYLAQSFKDAGDNESALKWYEERVKITAGFFEERYWSQFMVGQLKWTLCKPVSEVADAFMKASELDPLRCEHLFNLRIMYEKNGRPQSAKQIGYLIGRYKGKNPYPNRVLLINPHCYE